MTLDSEHRRLRAKPVGMLMRAYRHAFATGGNNKRLSQNGLLDLMGEVDREYADMDGHSTVARWESGATRPTRKRIEVFGQALNLSPAEIDGLISLAGLDHEDREPAIRSRSSGELGAITDCVPPNVSDFPHPVEAAEPVAQGVPSYAAEVLRLLLSRFFLPGFGIAGIGYFLSTLGISTTWMLTVYIILAIGIVLFGAFLRIRRADDLRELYFASIFVLLSTPMLQAPLLRMDIYGFYTFEGIADTPIPHLLALLVNLLLALSAGLMFDFLWRWQYSGGTGDKRAYTRAAWVVLPPLGVVYACIIVFSSTTTWIHMTAVFPIVAVVFTALALLRDKEISVSEWDRKFMLYSAVSVIIALSALGGATILTFYWQPSLLVMPDHNLFRSWDIDFSQFGYAPEELRDRVRLGLVWTSLASLTFIVVVIGGHLIATIHRIGGGNSAGLAGQTVQTVDASPSRIRRRRFKGFWNDVFGRFEWLAGNRRPQPASDRASSRQH